MATETYFKKEHPLVRLRKMLTETDETYFTNWGHDRYKKHSKEKKAGHSSFETTLAHTLLRTAMPKQHIMHQ